MSERSESEALKWARWSLVSTAVLAASLVLLFTVGDPSNSFAWVLVLVIALVDLYFVVMLYVWVGHEELLSPENRTDYRRLIILLGPVAVLAIYSQLRSRLTPGPEM